MAGGLACALGLNRFMTSLLFGVEPADATTLLIAIVTVLGIAALACWLPAWRASGWIRIFARRVVRSPLRSRYGDRPQDRSFARDLEPDRGCPRRTTQRIGGRITLVFSDQPTVALQHHAIDRAIGAAVDRSRRERPGKHTANEHEILILAGSAHPVEGSRARITSICQPP